MTQAAITRDEIAAFVERHAQAFDARDPEALASCHTVDGTVVSPMFATVHGRSAIEESYANLFATFPDWAMTVDDVIIDSPRLAILFKATATHVKDFFGLPGTHTRIALFTTFTATQANPTHVNDVFGLPGAHKKIEGAFVMVLDIAGGLIVRDRRIYDFTGLLVQAGALRAKPAKP